MNAGAAPPAIEVRDARRLYGQKAAVDGASLTLRAGRIACLLGPSGCGKSTLLRLIAGLEPADGGEVLEDGRVLSAPGVHVPPEGRDIGLVFQDYALFPHLTALENIGFGLRGVPAAERKARSMALLDQVRLADRAGAYPQALSGGEQQRVALARALARRPRAILLDEPFSGLDGRLKTEVRDTTLAALRAAGAAALIVTHDAEEAMLMADDLILMQAGRVLQSGPPRACYLQPASPAAALLLGEANLIPSDSPLGRTLGDPPAGPGVILVRPEGLRMVASGGVQARVADARFAGALTVVTLELDGASLLCRVPSEHAPAAGSAVRLSLDPAFSTTFPVPTY